MKQVLFSGSRTGVVTAPASKSMAHRLFIAAALGRAPVRIRCSGLSADVSATLACLRALGADIYQAEPDIYIVTPLSAPTEGALRPALRRERRHAALSAACGGGAERARRV